MFEKFDKGLIFGVLFYLTLVFKAQVMMNCIEVTEDISQAFQFKISFKNRFKIYLRIFFSMFGLKKLNKSNIESYFVFIKKILISSGEYNEDSFTMIKFITENDIGKRCVKITENDIENGRSFRFAGGTFDVYRSNEKYVSCRDTKTGSLVLIKRNELNEIKNGKMKFRKSFI